MKATDKTEPQAGTAPTEPTRNKPRPRWWRILLAVVGVLALLVALLPSVLSTAVSRRAILAKVNQRIDGELSIESWSLGWRSGLRLRNATFRDAEAGLEAHVASVVAPVSLVGLLRSHKDLGTIEIDTPSILMILPSAESAAGSAAGDDAAGKDRADSSTAAGSGQKPSPTPARPLDMDLTGRVILRNGSVTVSSPAATDGLHLQDLNVELDITSLRRPIRLQVTGSLGKERAELRVDAQATVSKDGMVGPDTTTGTLSAHVTGLDLAPLSTLGQHLGSPVHVAGMLNAAAELHLGGPSNLTLSGVVDFPALRLAGEPLGDDMPRLDQTTLDVDLRFRDQLVHVAKLKLSSPIAHADISGEVQLPDSGQLPRGNLTATADLDLPALAARFRHTMGLQEGLSIEAGTVSLNAQLTPGDTGARIEASVRLPALEATQGGRVLSLSQPVDLQVKLSESADGPRLDLLRLSSAFANGTGTGTVDKLDIVLTSDLAAATAEAGRFLDLAGKGVSGNARLELHIETRNARQRAVAAGLAVTDLEMHDPEAESMALARIHIDLSALGNFGPDNALADISDVVASLRSPLADADLTVARLVTVTNTAFPMSAQGGVLSVRANLADAVAVARAASALPEGLDLKGTLKLDAKLETDGTTVTVGGLSGSIESFEFSQDRKRLRDPRISLVGEASANLARRHIRVRDLAIGLAAGRVVVPRVEATDWAATNAASLPATMALNANVTMDLGLLTAQASDFMELPPDSKLTGKLQLAAQAGTSQNVVRVGLQGDVTELAFAQQGKPTIRDDQATLTADLAWDTREQAMTLDALALASDLVDLTATGRLDQISAARQLTAAGTLAVNFDQLGPLVAELTEQPIELAGHQSKPFKIETSLAGKEWQQIVREMLASAGIFASRVKIMGIETGEIDLPMLVADGKASIRLATTVGGGRLLLPATVDTTGAVPILTVSNNTPLLADVPITSDMADQFLAKASPLFKGALVSTGKVGVVIKSLTTPLDESAATQAAFEGELILDGVVLKASGFLLSLLEMVNAGNVPLVQLPDQRVALALRDGRFHQAPLSFQVGPHTLRLAGSVGVDTTLDMQVEIPVTLELVGRNKEVYEFLKDEVIRLPIKGTSLKPTMPKEALRASLAPLIQKATQKLMEETGGELIKGLEGLLKNLK